MEAALLLKLDDLGNSALFKRSEVRCIGLAFGYLVPLLDKAVWAKQGAHMLSSEWRAGLVG